MWNPFKKRYKISESNANGEIYYWVKYGWLWGHIYLDRDGDECSFWSTAEQWGGKFSSIDLAKKAIKNHTLAKINKRLSQPITKTIQYV